jgi:hypothetical protein
MTIPHKDPKDLFGADLIKIFGPKANRRHISTLTMAEKMAIVDKVPRHVETDDLGDRPSFFQITNKILSILQQTQALVGIDLDWCTDLKAGKLKRHNSAYTKIADCYKNNKVQRGIWLHHLLLDILFEFDPSNVLTGLSRRLSDGTDNLNNGQHRTVGCTIVGVREVPIEYIESDLESVDIDLYATDNLNTLSSSEFDDYRIRVRRNQVRKAEKRTDLIQKDIDRETMHDIHNRYGSRFVEKGSETVLAKECTGVGNMIKYYDMYGPAIYERAVSICCSVFSKATFATANAWAVMEFIETQVENGTMPDQQLMDWMIQQAIQHKYSDPKVNGMHLAIKQAYRDDMNTSAKEMAPEQKYLAAGIYKLCNTVSPEINWAPIKWEGKDVSKNLSGFKVMPVKKKIEVKELFAFA